MAAGLPDNIHQNSSRSGSSDLELNFRCDKLLPPIGRRNESAYGDCPPSPPPVYLARPPRWHSLHTSRAILLLARSSRQPWRLSVAAALPSPPLPRRTLPVVVWADAL